MTILNDVNVKTISMVKLGSNYYALKDEDAMRKSQLWDPEQPVTKQMLKSYYQPSFYENLGAAAVDINADTVGTGVTEDAQLENVAVYTDENGTTVVMLLSDVEEEATVAIAKDMILRLNGHTVSFNQNAIYVKVEATVDDLVIDGRVPGSGMMKTLTESTSKPNTIIDVMAKRCKFYGGAYHLNVTNNSNYCVAVSLKGNEFYGEDCSFRTIQQVGTGNIYGVLNVLGSMTLKNCTVECQANGGIARGVEARAACQDVRIIDSKIDVKAVNNIAVGFYPLCVQAVVKNSEITATLTVPSGNTAVGKATAVQQYANQLTIENCRLSSTSDKSHTNCIYGYQGEYRIINSTLQASSSESYAHAVENYQNAKAYMQDCVCFADAVTGETSGNYSVGIVNNGKLTLKNCTVRGIHSGMQLLPGSHTHATGGTFEGVGHGGIYFSHQNGSAFIQDAAINSVKYSGKYKATFQYANQYGVAAMYVGSSDGNGGISVYMDNCVIDGEGPLSNGAEPIRFRDSNNELNNAVYMSNCTVAGDGNMRFGNSSHRLYNGLSNRIMTGFNISECVEQTGIVYHCAPGMPADMPEMA